MDFARKILANYGWKEGDGLGKNKDGIAKPLKATLKFDNAGFGADQAAADFNNHWWERVFNEAATNVNIQKEGEQIKMVLKDDTDGVEISTKGYSVKKLKKLKEKHGEEAGEAKMGYDNFLQSATLTNLGGEIENPDKIDVNDIEVTKVKVLTDEELFKACGGRTAHKGARHGLKLSGKLSRIEQQEAELLAKMMAKRNADDNKTSGNKFKMEVEANNCDDDTEQKVKKKKKKSKVREEEPTQEYANKTSQDDEIIQSKRKCKVREEDKSQECLKEAPLEVVQSDKKRKSKVREEEESQQCLSDEVNQSKKKKKRKQENESLEESVMFVEGSSNDECKKKKKVKKTKNCEESINLVENSELTIDEASTLSKKKKNKEYNSNIEEIVPKKKKKKNKE